MAPVSAVDERLLEVLRCPVTHGPLRLLTPSELRATNKRIAAGRAVHSDGTPVGRPLASGLASRDGTLVYPVEDGVIVLLKELAIQGAIGGRNEAPPRAPGGELREEKRQVQRFYDEVGWTRAEGDIFDDAERFEDLRPVAREYIHRCHMRVNRYLAPGGRFFLDAASGPIQYPEYLSYSEGYDLRICVDISLVALKAAKRKLGDRGAYLLADVTNLPLDSGTMDAALSLHTVYHVPRDEQEDAVRELHRVLRPGASGALVYTWGGRPPLMRLVFLPFSLLRRLLRAPGKLLSAASRALGLRRSEREASPPGLYSHTHNYGFFRDTDWGFDLNMRVWRAVSVEFTKTFAKGGLGGRQLLRLVYWLEERFPYWAGRLGQYPLFVIGNRDARDRASAVGNGKRGGVT
ncbi:MAG: methyltransferase domain-containing protein [Planctomycetota bacterium]|jgi:SAM-dependent methyltransferase/uncharacterized protein YbaR (Trm112 family)